jgi:NADH:ubiquinone oxidoreductase subunit 6 (subunit J)
MLDDSLLFQRVETWGIIPVMLLGAAAIYLLLPRPRPSPVPWGIALGGLSLVLGGVLLTGMHLASPETILFYAFSAITIIAGALLVTQRNPARAALAFALVILSTTGLFLLLAAPFLMAATIIIYAGAIVVTFLFVLMLAQQEGMSDADFRSREPLLSSIAGFLLLGTLLYVLQASYGNTRIKSLLDQTNRVIADLEDFLRRNQGDQDQAEHREERGELLKAAMEVLGKYQKEGLRVPALRKEVDPDDKFGRGWEFQTDGKVRDMVKLLEEVRDKTEALPATATTSLQPPTGAGEPERPLLSELSGPASSRPFQEIRQKDGRPELPAENSAYLGRSLFSDYLLAVELGGTLLLVATVGAIAIAHRRPTASAVTGDGEPAPRTEGRTP